MSHRSDDVLRSFLTSSSEDVLATLVELMDSVWSLKSKRFRRFHTPALIPSMGTPERAQLVDEILVHLGYFGSETFSYWARKTIKRDPGVTYLTMLRDVTRFLNTMLRPQFDVPVLGKALHWFGLGGRKPFKIPRVATVEDYELLIVEMLVAKHVRSKSQSELITALREAGLDQEASEDAVVQLTKTGIQGGVMLFLVKLLGKKAIKEIVLNILVAYVEGAIGKVAAKKLAESIAQKTTQKVFAKLASGAGWVLLAYDAFSLGSPATRITVPAIAYLSTMRYLSLPDQTQ